MKPVVSILIAEPNLYLALGFSHGLLMHFNSLGFDVHFSENLLDKNNCDMIFIAAEYDTAGLRYLTQRQTGPTHQRIYLFKEKPSQYDKVQFKKLDGIFYRHQSMNWAMQIATEGLRSLPLSVTGKVRKAARRTPLTCREVEILRYLANGQRACEISRYLQISAKTVSGHKRNAMTKLGIKRSSDLNYWLIRGNMGKMASSRFPVLSWNRFAELQSGLVDPFNTPQYELLQNRTENNHD